MVARFSLAAEEFAVRSFVKGILSVVQGQSFDTVGFSSPISSGGVLCVTVRGNDAPKGPGYIQQLRWIDLGPNYLMKCPGSPFVD